jgi:predicted Zn finger-like uncharacterized protein
VNVTCPECSSIFRVDPAKVPAGGVRARCSVCSGIIPVPGSRGAGAPVRPTPRAQVPAPVGDAARETARTGEFSLSGAMPWSGGSEGGGAGSPSATSSPFPAEQVKGPAAPGAAAAGRRPINPFLNKDPNLRAKRLARALVSDIITYQPAKHAEGLRDGTIRELFKDEIRKSYEEYTAQVGQQLAESTPYFQEALNDVLGGGKKIF